MLSNLDDRYLWLGAGVFAFIAVKAIRHALTDLMELSREDPASLSPSTLKGELPENAISLSDLKTLISNPNPNISSAASSLVVSRFLRLPEAARIIAKDVNSARPQVRERANRAVKFLRSSPFTHKRAECRVLHPSGYQSPLSWSAISDDEVADSEDESEFASDEAREMGWLGRHESHRTDSSEDTSAERVFVYVGGGGTLEAQESDDGHSDEGGDRERDRRRMHREAMVFARRPR